MMPVCLVLDRAIHCSVQVNIGALSILHGSGAQVFHTAMEERLAALEPKVKDYGRIATRLAEAEA